MSMYFESGDRTNTNGSFGKNIPNTKIPTELHGKEAERLLSLKSIYYTTALTQFQLYHHFGNSEHFPFH